MTVVTEAGKGLTDVFINGLRKQGFLVVFLVVVIAILFYKDQTAYKDIRAENTDLKAENKSLRSQFYGEIINNQRKMIQTQNTLENNLEHLIYKQNER